MLITITLNGQKLLLCNIYAPNDQVNQLQFMQELKNCIIDKSELTSLIVGGDWNCTLSKKDKFGGIPWKPSSYRNLIVTTIEMFDLVDIQRMRHPKLRKFTYESKSLKLKSRIDFFFKNCNKSLWGCKEFGNLPCNLPCNRTITFRYLGPTNLLAQLILESYNNSYNRVKISPRGGVTIFGVKITPKRSYFTVSELI